MAPLILKKATATAEDAFQPFKNVQFPMGEPVAQTRAIKPTPCADGSSMGVWECTPGKWPRQVALAEFCVFLAGRCKFTSKDGMTQEFTAGDAVFFPRNTEGIWDVEETLRKVYIVF